jgi:putative heme transporter
VVKNERVGMSRLAPVARSEQDAAGPSGPVVPAPAQPSRQRSGEPSTSPAIALSETTTTTPPAAEVGVGSATDRPRSKRQERSLATRNALRSFKVLALAALVYYVVLPQFANAREAAQTLRGVNIPLLLLGLGLEAAALFSYSLLTRAALPADSIRLGTLFRIQLSTKAIGSVVPGGNAASSALGFRLLTTAGISGPDAGFALAAAGLGSAVVLNLILWLALLISIPLSGVKPVYVTVALVGVVILLVFAMLVFLLLRGQARAERIARRLAAKVTFVDEERAAHTVTHLADRLRELIGRPDLLSRLVTWSVLNWMLDAAALGVFLYAFGGSIRMDELVISFCIVNVMAVVPITPGGLGVVELMYPSLLTSIFGMPFTVVAYGVAAYRIAQLWLPIPIGGLAYLSLRMGPWKIARDGSNLRGLREEVRGTSSTSTTGQPAS